MVRLARHRPTGEMLAVKTVIKSKVRRACERRSFDQLERERQVLQLLRRAWGLSELASATQLICSAHDASCLYLVMRAYLGGNLATLLATHGPLTENSARFYLANIALGLELLHVLGALDPKHKRYF